MSEETTEQENENDEFDKAWSDANDLSDSENELDAPADEVVTELETGVEDDATDKNDASDDKQTEADNNGQVDDDPRFAKFEDQLKSIGGRLSASDLRNNELADENKSLREKLEGLSKPEKKDEADDDEESPLVVSQFQEDYPDIFEAVQTMTRAGKIGELDSALSKEVEDGKTRINAIESTFEQQQRDAHFAAIEGEHSDWKDIIQGQDLSDWIEGQPAFLRGTYQSIVETGTASQINEMFSLFKGDSTQKPDQVPVKTEQVIKTRKTPIPGKGKVDKDDFDAGWDEANSA